ncbi:hypothetical protein [Anaerolinea sp.]|uniref:hypothetical protein n=1 Tax=Anaerolinea sp. TaxID=1872519 RepID=UPI002ACEDCF1|nr:hypothetical protein [Anaerolinea sp.]
MAVVRTAYYRQKPRCWVTTLSRLPIVTPQIPLRSAGLRYRTLRLWEQGNPNGNQQPHQGYLPPL